MAVKILIVDDEPDVRSVLGKKLESRGFEVLAAGDGIDGMKQVQAHKPDLILLDIMMPQKDGFAMLKDLQASQELRRIPVIMVSAKAETDALFTGKELGATDYLIKPIDFDELLKFIRKYT